MTKHDVHQLAVDLMEAEFGAGAWDHVDLRHLRITREQLAAKLLEKGWASNGQQIISDKETLDTLPVGSVVMTLWDDRPLHYVMQRYSDDDGRPGGWYGFPSKRALYPLGSARKGEQVAVLWRPEGGPR